MLETVSNLPNRYNSLTPKDFAIYVLDDYAVHLMPEIRKALYQRGYVLVVIGGGITRFIQANDTDLHHHIKSCYRNEEIAFMLKKLDVDKVPSPSPEQMIEILLAAWKETDVDFTAAFVTNAFDGSEDFLMSNKLFPLIGDEMLEYRRELLNSEVPANLQVVIKKLIPPKDFRRANFEGRELLDYMEGEAIFDDLEATQQSDNKDLFSSDEENDQENVALEQDNEVSTTNTPAPPKPCVISSFQNICSDPAMSRGAKFSDDLQKVFEDNDTSLMFKPHLNKMKSAFYEARRSVKKRILTKNNVNKQRKDKENANEPENTNALVNIAQDDDSLNCCKTCK